MAIEPEYNINTVNDNGFEILNEKVDHLVEQMDQITLLIKRFKPIIDQYEQSVQSHPRLTRRALAWKANQ